MSDQKKPSEGRHQTVITGRSTAIAGGISEVGFSDILSGKSAARSGGISEVGFSDILSGKSAARGGGIETCGCRAGVPHVNPAVVPFDAPRRIQMPNDQCMCGSEKKYKKCCGRGRG